MPAVSCAVAAEVHIASAVRDRTIRNFHDFKAAATDRREQSKRRRKVRRIWEAVWVLKMVPEGPPKRLNRKGEEVESLPELDVALKRLRQAKELWPNALPFLGSLKMPQKAKTN